MGEVEGLIIGVLGLGSSAQGLGPAGQETVLEAVEAVWCSEFGVCGLRLGFEG